MFDALLRRRIDPALDALAGRLAARGVTADALTGLGAAAGLAAGAAIAAGWLWTALGLIALSRLADGLDGALARRGRGSPMGGLYDVVGDAVFYAAIPLGFAALDPDANALAAAFLLAGFLVNLASFLGLAAVAGRRGLRGQDGKAFRYTTGLTEGAETIATFVLMCLWPAGFALLATVFAALCLVSAAARVVLSGRLLG